MEIVERLWELLGLFWGILKAIERATTSFFGSSNAHYIRRLSNKVEAITGLKPKYKAMTNTELNGDRCRAIP